ncbi:LLM class oxidoreductase [Polaribacter sp. Hel1_85]|uniref:LLM class oxidoreductase n=1 Tax=Polaribacter sp. Hel1_85 TaxID=1250005 RepID=UPI00052E2C27|nr:LLM class oxidoreductase [Polaribacter sp. Hel1_85]KGL63424.1 N5,N10-methylene tetrahydromethanopterin reductase [Polaribacter sp. Hel1_85]
MKVFENINKAYNAVFKQNELSIGVVVPIENYSIGTVSTMQDHLKRVKQVENLGFKAIWIRDIPFNVPNFGDAGQTFDPFTYLGYLAGQTSDIALGFSSIALPLHHPLNVAKSAATIDQLSNGRLLLGVASGDRFEEYPAMGIEYEKRGELFRESFDYIRKVQNNFPTFKTQNYGSLQGNIDMLPKSTSHKIPMLITGGSRQTLEWNVKNADGWMNYPRDLHDQQIKIKHWRKLIEESQEFDKPFMQPLYLDLHHLADFKPQPIQLGFRLGINYFIDYIDKLRKIGVNHLALNLRFNAMNIDETLELIAHKILPEFHSLEKNK